MVDHNTLTANHVPYTGTFATESARLNATGLTVDDIGKEFLQSDNNSHWMLAAVSPSLVWVQTDPPVRPPTTADIALYLDSVAGDDDNDGSSSAPFKTFTRALRDVLNKDIQHVVKLFPKAGTYTEFPRYYNPKISPGGRLISDASGETYPVIAGPFTIGAVTGVGVQDLWSFYPANDLQVTPNPSWSSDAYYGKFAHFLTGNYTGYVVPIWSNDGDSIRTYFDWVGFQVGDTFEIVDCPVVIEVDHEIHIKGDTPGEFVLGSHKPHLLFAGIKFKIDTGDKTVIPFFVNSLSTICSFCAMQDVWDTDSGSIPIGLRNSDLNWASVPSGSFINDKFETYFTHAFMPLSMNGAPPIAKGFDLVIWENNILTGITNLQCRRSIFAESGDEGLFWVMSGGYTNNSITTGKSVSTGLSTIDHLYIEQIGYDDIALDISAHIIIAEMIYIEKCDLPVSLSENASLIVGWLKGNTIANAYAAEIKRGGQLQATSATHVIIAGSIGVIKFLLDGTTHATWPTTGNSYSKVNSFVVME